MAIPSLSSMFAQPRHQAFLIMVGVVMVFVLLQFNTPGQSSLLPPCFFHDITGMFCPGCGITRALHALVHGNVRRALDMHVLAVISIPLLSLMLIHLLFNRPVWPMAWFNTLMKHLFDARPWAIVFVVFFVLRNIPHPAFSWMSP